MKFYLISDNADTLMGMRLAGIEGVVVKERTAVLGELSNAFEREDIGIVLITEKLIKLCPDEIYDLKLNRKSPLIVEIPNKEGASNITQSIEKYVSEAVGIKL